MAIEFGDKIYYIVYIDPDTHAVEVPLFVDLNAKDETLANLKKGHTTILKEGFEYLNADAL